MDDYTSLSIGDWSIDLRRKLGSGTWSEVYYAVQQSTGLEAAAKIVEKARLKPHEKNFVSVEVECLRKLHHSNILKLYHYYEDQTNHYMFLEYCTGGELFTLLDSHVRLNEAQSRRFFTQLVEAVQTCHNAGVIHRDLKLENLLLTSADLNGKLKLCDFGLSAIQRNQTDLLAQWVGSPEYASPELVNKKPYSTEVDVWAMGVILYVLVVGHHPFTAPNVHQTFQRIRYEQVKLPDYVPLPLRDLIQRMLHKDSAKRLTIAEIRRHPWFLNAQPKQQMDKLLRLKTNVSQFTNALSLRQSM